MRTKVLTWLAIFFGIIVAQAGADLFEKSYGTPKSVLIELGLGLLCVFVFLGVIRIASYRNLK
jgi:hypothetical protein